MNQTRVTILTATAVLLPELSEEAAVRWLSHLADEKGDEFDPSSVNGPMTLY